MSRFRARARDADLINVVPTIVSTNTMVGGAVAAAASGSLTLEATDLGTSSVLYVLLAHSTPEATAAMLSRLYIEFFDSAGASLGILSNTNARSAHNFICQDLWGQPYAIANVLVIDVPKLSKTMKISVQFTVAVTGYTLTAIELINTVDYLLNTNGMAGGGSTGDVMFSVAYYSYDASNTKRPCVKIMWVFENGSSTDLWVTSVTEAGSELVELVGGNVRSMVYTFSDPTAKYASQDYTFNVNRDSSLYVMGAYTVEWG